METLVGNPVIDESAVPPPALAPSGDDWETPPRKYFGKKMPNGKLEPEKPYVFIPYPAARYSQPGGEGTPISKVLVQNEAEDKALGPGWSNTPATFGFIGAPSRDQILRMTKSPAQILIDAQAEKDAYAKSEAAMQAKAEAEATAAKQLAEQRAADEEKLNARIAEAVAKALAGQSKTLHVKN